jgi:hypothetical protein
VVGDLRERKQTAARSTGENDSLHTLFMIHPKRDTTGE